MSLEALEIFLDSGKEGWIFSALVPQSLGGHCATPSEENLLEPHQGLRLGKHRVNAAGHKQVLSFPSFYLLSPAGALADLIDRRRLLLSAQGWMFVAPLEPRCDPPERSSHHRQQYQCEIKEQDVPCLRILVD